MMPRVLVVDDEQNIRLTLTKALAALDVTPLAAVSGEEALRHLAEVPIAVMLLDLRLPAMSGMDVLRRVVNLSPRTRVVMITAHGSVESAVEAMKLGAVDFLQKPFSAQEVRDVVTRVLARTDAEAPDEGAGFEEHMEFARKLLGERDPDGARRHVSRALAAEPGRPEPQNLLGALAEIRGDRDQAMKHYRSALSLDPAYEPARTNLHRLTGIAGGGIVLREEGKTGRRRRG